MTPKGNVRDHLHQNPQALSLKQLSLVPDKPWARLPEFVCLKPLLGWGVLPEWGLFAGEQHHEFTGQSAHAEEQVGRGERGPARETGFPISLAIGFGQLLVRIDQHIWQSVQRKVWRLNWNIHNLFNRVCHQEINEPDSRSKRSMMFHAQHVPQESQQRAMTRSSSEAEHLREQSHQQHVSLFFPVLGKLIETSARHVMGPPALNRLQEKANPSSEPFSYGDKSQVGKEPRQTQDVVFRDRLVSQTLEKLTAREANEWEAAKPNDVSKQRAIKQQLQTQHGRHRDEQSAEITETQQTITRLLSMANETKETETQARQEQHHMLKDLETKIEGMQGLTKSDLQMLRHMMQNLAEKFDRQPRMIPAPRMKRWSFYGPL